MWKENSCTTLLISEEFKDLGSLHFFTYQFFNGQAMAQRLFISGSCYVKDARQD